MDFGLAKERRAGPDVVKLTATGIVLGTPGVHEPGADPGQAAGRPERCLRAGHSGVRDVYRAAAVYREERAGDDDRASPGSAAATARGQGRLPAKLESVISKALSVNPADRYGSMAELAHAFESAASTGVLGRLFREGEAKRTGRTGTAGA